MTTPVLDRFDFALLDALQRDNGVPLRALADAVCLSTASVQRRVQRLNKEAVIQANTAVIDPDKVGQVITIIVEVQADRTQSADLDAMKTTFSGPEIQQCYYVTGEADFLLILNVASMRAFQSLAQRLFHDNPNVKWFRTLVVLDRVKASLHVPLASN